MNLLFTSAGRRVSLLRQFKESKEKLGIDGYVVAVDLKKNASASFVADCAEQVPSVEDPGYADSLLKVCEDHKIDLLIPLIDSELLLLSGLVQRFAQAGIRILVSSSEANKICIDKRNTYQFFKDNQINTPALFSFEDAVNQPNFIYPVVVKPADGSCSIGVNKVKNFEELEFFFKHTKNAIIQAYASGEEYTLDILLDFEGAVKMVVPRLRMETRAGEISKGVTIKNPLLIAAGRKVAEALPGAVGCITAQCFLTAAGEVKFIEVNPRFGGGFPLSYRAGADYPGYIMKMMKGEAVDVPIDGWQDGVVMLRYDDAIFTTKEMIE